MKTRFDLDLPFGARASSPAASLAGSRALLRPGTAALRHGSWSLGSSTRNRWLSLPVLVSLLLSSSACAAAEGLNVRDFGAKGDGQTDDTAAFQQALDAAAKAGGGTVTAPRGNYFFAGHLNVPPAVTLQGRLGIGARPQRPPRPRPAQAHRRRHDLPRHRERRQGGRARRSSRSTTTAPSRAWCSTIPNQKADDVPEAYPWAIAMRGKNPAVLAVELLNPYNGIDATQNERHLIRDVQGQPLRRGIFVDQHLRHRPHRERPFQPLVEHEAQALPVADGERRGVHLRPQRLAVRLQHLLLRLQRRLQVHQDQPAASATATSSASAPTIATRPWWSRNPRPSAC